MHLSKFQRMHELLHELLHELYWHSNIYSLNKSTEYIYNSRARTFGRGTDRRGTVHRGTVHRGTVRLKKNLFSASLG